MKKIIALLVVLALILCSVESAFAYDKSIDTDLNDKSIYYVKNYTNNACVLSANMYMLRRAAIINGSTCWDNITLKKLRPKACTSRRGNSMRYSYEYSLDGVTYSVTHDVLSGSAANRKAKLKKMLKKHPEGIVVRGRSTSGYGHGILVTSYRDGVFRAADSAQNKGKFNKGILKMTSTTVRNIGTCYHIWYISGQSGKAITAVKRIKPENVKLRYEEKKINISWSTSSKYHKINGYTVYRSSEKSGKYSKIKTTTKNSISIENTFDDSVCYLKVRGYVKKGTRKVYTDYKIIKVKMLSDLESEISDKEDPTVSETNLTDVDKIDERDIISTEEVLSDRSDTESNNMQTAEADGENGEVLNGEDQARQ